MTPRTLGLIALLIVCATKPGPAEGNEAPRAERAPNPLGGGGAVTLQPVPPAARIGNRRIFFCRDADPVILSDRPCEQQPLEAQARTETPRKEAGDTSLCRRLRAEFDELDERIRSAREDTGLAGLWRRQDALEQALNRHGC